MELLDGPARVAHGIPEDARTDAVRVDEAVGLVDGAPEQQVPDGGHYPAPFHGVAPARGQVQHLRLGPFPLEGAESQIGHGQDQADPRHRL